MRHAYAYIWNNCDVYENTTATNCSISTEREFFSCLEVVTSERVTAWRRHESVATRATVVRRRRSFVTKRGGVAGEVLARKKERVGRRFAWRELEQKRKNWGESGEQNGVCKAYTAKLAPPFVRSVRYFRTYWLMKERNHEFQNLNANLYQLAVPPRSFQSLPLFFSLTLRTYTFALCHFQFYILTLVPVIHENTLPVTTSSVRWYHGVARSDRRRRKRKRSVHETTYECMRTSCVSFYMYVLYWYEVRQCLVVGLFWPYQWLIERANSATLWPDNESTRITTVNTKHWRILWILWRFSIIVFIPIVVSYGYALPDV